MRQTVSACLIVRNEEENLPHCLGSLKGTFDEIVVLDTGSTDGTAALAESLGAKVFHFKWRDHFGAARNACRSHATGDWIFWFDADDRLDPDEAEKLRRLFDRLPPADQPAPVYVMNCRSRTPNTSDTFDIAHTRLFRNKSDIRWRGRIHEYLIHDPTGNPDDQRDLAPNEIAFTDIVVRHDGYDDPQVWAAKQTRDLRILFSEYLLRPDDALTPFYIGRCLASQTRVPEAVEFFRRAIAVDPQVARSSTPKSYTMLIKCLVALGRRDEAIQVADDVRTKVPFQYELWFEAGSLFMSAGRLKEAEDCFRTLAGRSTDDQRRAGLPSHMTPLAARRMLAEVLILRGAVAPAADILRQVLSEEPQQVAGWLLLGELAVQQNWQSDVQVAVSALSAMPHANGELHLLKAMSLLSRRQFAEAIGHAVTATQLRSHMAGPWVLLGKCLLAEGRRWNAAADALSKALSMNPSLKHLQPEIDRARNMAKAAATSSRLEPVPKDATDYALPTMGDSNFAFQGGAA